MAIVETVEVLERLCKPAPHSADQPAVVIVAAHPDDESIGAGSLLPHLGRLHLIHVTDGAPHSIRDARVVGMAHRTDHARVRRRELQEALALAGIAPQRHCCLGLVDQEASLEMPALIEKLAEKFAQWKPEIVVTQPYEGGHPDHDATALAVHAACRLLELRGWFEQSDGVRPLIVEMTSFHAGPAGMCTGEFLPDGDCPVACRVLSEAEQAFKRQLLDCFRTQRRTLQYFDVRTECFRCAPDYDFSLPPHPGKLFYENLPWGMTGARWRLLAAGALHSLDQPASR